MAWNQPGAPPPNNYQQQNNQPPPYNPGYQAGNGGNHGGYPQQGAGNPAYDNRSSAPSNPPAQQPWQQRNPYDAQPPPAAAPNPYRQPPPPGNYNNPPPPNNNPPPRRYAAPPPANRYANPPPQYPPREDPLVAKDREIQDKNREIDTLQKHCKEWKARWDERTQEYNNEKSKLETELRYARHSEKKSQDALAEERRRSTDSSGELEDLRKQVEALEDDNSKLKNLCIQHQSYADVRDEERTKDKEILDQYKMENGRLKEEVEGLRANPPPQDEQTATEQLNMELLNQMEHIGLAKKKVQIKLEEVIKERDAAQVERNALESSVRRLRENEASARTNMSSWNDTAAAQTRKIKDLEQRIHSLKKKYNAENQELKAKLSLIKFKGEKTDDYAKKVNKLEKQREIDIMNHDRKVLGLEKQLTDMRSTKQNHTGRLELILDLFKPLIKKIQHKGKRELAERDVETLAMIKKHLVDVVKGKNESRSDSSPPEEKQSTFATPATSSSAASPRNSMRRSPQVSMQSQSGVLSSVASGQVQLSKKQKKKEKKKKGKSLKRGISKFA